ncbi:hypothetical protein G7Y89_g1072 [Cudoniella acicularis]|uniref:F-box domain-containing protein n=1 Tax=Cudoniella acicularis TaxID=354080 RepID=A0A8H4W7R8_9HELO|nr:hypothetical protein G7Y89_g1072 [Cudoniella acicularis]
MPSNRPRGKKSTIAPQPQQHRRNSRNDRNVLNIPAVASASATPPSSTYPSTYPTEDEEDSAKAKKIQPFRFLDLPSELRTKIYTLAFAAVPAVIDLDPHTFSLLHRQNILSLFRVSRQIHLESSHHFFSIHTFRLFPTYPGRYFKTKRPLLARLPAHYRSSITSLELRLGPGWNNPPRGWLVNEALGLADCKTVRVLKVFVQCDPSDAIYKGWSMGDGVYERFCSGLLDSVLKDVPTVQVVEFDAYPAVKRSGDMMSGLAKVVSKYDKVIGWGPESGWGKEDEQIAFLDAVLMHGAGIRSSKSNAVLAENAEISSIGSTYDFNTTDTALMLKLL